jgi:hypothetical protein
MLENIQLIDKLRYKYGEQKSKKMEDIVTEMEKEEK